MQRKKYDRISGEGFPITAHMPQYGFIPGYVLENIARVQGEERGIAALTVRRSAALTLQQDMLIRQKRSKFVNNMAEFVSLKAVGESARIVYDCKSTYEPKKLLARQEGDPPVDDEIVNKVYDYLGTIRDWFKEQLNRNSIDNAYMNIIANVHYGESYLNALWDGEQVLLGDGDNETFVSFANSLDVVGHEVSHGVTQWEANLEYDGQSGALNEHFSDVFGSAIKQFAAGETADTAEWLIGEEIMGPSLQGEALRSMCNPGTAYDNDLLGKDMQPDHMSNYYDGPLDNHGVHINSGIPNKAFCLSAKKIGTDKAALVWYTALQDLWPTATFNDAVKVILDSAKALRKKKEIPTGATQKIRAAFKAVGLPT